LSGVVFEQTASGKTPLAGIDVLLNEPSRLAAFSTTTDANGFYQFKPVPTISSVCGTHTVCSSSQIDVHVTAADYTGVIQRIAVSGETHLDVALVHRSFYTLSGVVSETSPDGSVPVAGVVIDVDTCDGGSFGCAVSQHLTTTTDRNGSYNLPGVWAGQSNGVWVFKEGHLVYGANPPSDCDGCARLITASGNTQLDLQLVR
jgi:hypothetical protein